MSMEKKVRKKRSQASPSNKEGKDRVKTSLTEVQIKPQHKILDIPLNPDTARQAVILSEVIGKPVSKRSRKYF